MGESAEEARLCGENYDLYHSMHMSTLAARKSHGWNYKLKNEKYISFEINFFHGLEFLPGALMVVLVPVRCHVTHPSLPVCINLPDSIIALFQHQFTRYLTLTF